MILRCADDARWDRREEQRQLNHELASWIAFAHHQPAKIPKYEPIEPKGAKAGKQAESQELQLAKVRGYFIGRALHTEAARRS